MTADEARRWIKEHRWWMALTLILVAGYWIGKDMALRDNARDAAVVEAR